MRYIILGIVCVLGFCLVGVLMGEHIDSSQKYMWQGVTEQAYADSLSHELRGRISQMFDRSPTVHWKGRVVARQVMNLRNGGDMTFVAVEAYSQIFPCLQLGFEFAIGDSVQILDIAHRQPGTSTPYNHTYFVIPLR